MVPPERVELASPAPEAGTLSTELQGHCTTRIAWLPRGQQGCTRHLSQSVRAIFRWTNPTPTTRLVALSLRG